MLIGLLGSIHCAGMCGGFVFALAQTSRQKRHFVLRQSLYYLGKTVTYAALGFRCRCIWEYAGDVLFQKVQLMF